MADELTTLVDTIKEKEEELQERKTDIRTIRTGDNAAVEALVKKLEFDSLGKAMKALRKEKGTTREAAYIGQKGDSWSAAAEWCR
jgi:hypothetical protein